MANRTLADVAETINPAAFESVAIVSLHLVDGNPLAAPTVPPDLICSTRWIQPEHGSRRIVDVVEGVVDMGFIDNIVGFKEQVVVVEKRLTSHSVTVPRPISVLDILASTQKHLKEPAMVYFVG